MERMWDISTNLDAWDEARDEMFQAMKACGIAADEANSYLVGVEEAAVNIIQYAYPINKSSSTFQVRLVITDPKQGERSVECALYDNGIPFDPTQKVGKTPGGRDAYKDVGGWGIQMIRTKVDEMRYERSNNQNILVLTKTMEVK